MKRFTTVVAIVFALSIFPRFISLGVAADKNTASSDNTNTSTSISSSSAFVVEPDPSISINEKCIKAGLLYDADNKKIVWQKEIDKELPIASLTKMMVALLAIEDIHAGKISWDDNVRWTRETVMRINRRNQIVHTQASYSVRDLFKAAMIASNNECAEALARYLEGNDLQAALDRMNLRAKELGMNNTWYGNPTGLPAAKARLDNHSTPADLLLLALEMIKYKDILDVTGMGYADVTNGESVNIIRNHNHLTIDYSGDVDGMKTGYTRHAGFCLVATSKKCDHRLISIALGARAPEVRNNLVADMINKYYIAIGEDKLAPSCYSPLKPTTGTSTEEDEGSGVVYQLKTVKDIHTVYKGETLTAIAKNYDCSLTDIVKWNHLSTVTLKPGRKLIVYSKIKVPADSTALNNDPSSITMLEATPAPKKKVTHPAPVNDKYMVYIVQPGDTLSSIAQNHNGVTVQQIKAMNGLSRHHVLRVGAKLKVPVSS